MAKIIITYAGEFIQEVELSKERITIGRHPHNDIVLEQRAVSSFHALLTSILDDVFLEDLHSTNGTFVNGQRIRKHLLTPHDEITLAKFQIKFIANPRAPAFAAPIQPPPIAAPRPAPMVPSPPTISGDAAALLPTARIDILNGSNAGSQMVLNKPLTTLGRPGQLVVVISRRQDGYFLAYLEGERAPLVNGVALGSEPRRLVQGDVIELLGTQLAFSIS